MKGHVFKRAFFISDPVAAYLRTLGNLNSVHRAQIVNY
jgi:hypothetical protein